MGVGLLYSLLPSLIVRPKTSRVWAKRGICAYHDVFAMGGVCSRWLFCVKQYLILDTKPQSIKHGSGPRWVHSLMDIFSRMY